MTNDHEAWLKLTPEDPIDPELPICDPHQHLWDHPGDNYFLKEFLQDARGGGHNIVQSVFIECGTMYRKSGDQNMLPVGETEFVQSVAAETESGKYGVKVAAGIIGFADLTLGAAVAPVLEAHLAASPAHFRGIRNLVTWDASPIVKPYGKFKGMYFDPKFREGFACLHKYGLSFDSWQFFTQLLELKDLAKAFPDTTIICCHTGGILGVGPYAGKRDEVFQEWKRNMTALATCPNVVVKLGGFGMPRYGFGWHERARPPGSTELAEVMEPYFSVCLEQFGVHRCMFESNFPVDRESFSYTAIWNTFKRIARGYSPAERAALFHDTAAKVYRLDLSLGRARGK